jgi:hypothetical protein
LRNNSLLGSTSRLSGKPSKPYTVGLSIIDDKTIDGAGGVYYLSQTVSGGGDGNQELKSYYTPLDDVAGKGYYNIENGSTYYNVVSEPII